MKSCQYCGAPMPLQDKRCPQCQRIQQTDMTATCLKVFLVIGIVILIVFGGCVLLMLTNNGYHE